MKRKSFFYPPALIQQLQQLADAEQIPISQLARLCMGDGVEIRLIRQRARTEGQHDGHLLWGAAYLLDDYRKRIKEGE